MPKRKAIILPDWLIPILRSNRTEGSIYEHTPAVMHWKPLEMVAEALHDSTPHSSTRTQIREVIDDLAKQIKQNTHSNHPLVAHIEYPKNFPFQVIVTIAEDVKLPKVTGHLVIRTYQDGKICDVIREYLMGV